jgi:hypothetical protein
MTTLIWVIIGIVLLGGVIAVVIVGMRSFRNRDDEADPLLARLAEAGQRGEVL